MRVLGVLVLGVALGACSAVPCSTDEQCPASTHCDISPAESTGHCTQDCVPLAPCGSGGQCDGRGRCALPAETLALHVTEPAEGATLAAGTVVDVAGTVRFTGEPVTVVLGGLDSLGCTPAAPQQQELLEPGPEGEAAFRFTGVAVGEGGGSWLVKATQDVSSVKVERSYVSGRLCEGCPSVRLSSPAPVVSLEAHALGVTLTGRVEGALAAPILFSQDSAGRVLRMPLALESSAFAGRVVPLSPGENLVGVEVSGTSGSRRCLRRVTAGDESAPLSVHLSWEGTASDLDLAVVPPSATLGPQSCRADSTVGGCQFPTGNRVAPGPEAALLTQLQDGAYGIAVLAVPGDEGPIHATVTVLLGGAVALRAGPRWVDPRDGEVWLVARVVTGGLAPRVDVMDQVVSAAPVRSPADW